jgi:hypothetical protein
VLVRIKGFISGAAAVAMLCATTGAPVRAQAPAGQSQAPAGQAAAGQPQWKDRAEYDLFESIRNEQDPKKKIALLNQWKEKYPGSEFKKVRAGLLVQSYQAAKDVPGLVAAARDLIDSDPKDVSTLAAVVALAMQMNDSSPELLDLTEKAANGLIANIDNKPATVTDDQWKTQKPITEALGYRGLGWVAMMRKNAPDAEKNFTKSLELNPAQGDVSYWLGQTIMGERKVELYPKGLFHIARAATYDGPGALAPAGRQPVDAYLQKAYAGYHGDASGLDDLKKLAKTNALPPAGWTIKSVKEVAEDKLKQEEEAAKANPQLALWKRIKEELQGANGQQYWDTGMKDAAVGVPDANNTPVLTGTVIEQKSPKELVLAIGDEKTPELTLVADAAVGKVEPGTKLTFTGVAKSYTANPFMVTMEAEKKDIKGLPAAAPAHRAPAARKPVHRK